MPNSITNEFQERLITLARKNGTSGSFSGNINIFKLANSKQIMDFLLDFEKNFKLKIIDYLHHTDLTVFYIIQLIKRQTWCKHRKNGSIEYSNPIADFLSVRAKGNLDIDFLCKTISSNLPPSRANTILNKISKETRKNKQKKIATPNELIAYDFSLEDEIVEELIPSNPPSVNISDTLRRIIGGIS